VKAGKAGMRDDYLTAVYDLRMMSEQWDGSCLALGFMKCGIGREILRYSPGPAIAVGHYRLGRGQHFCWHFAAGPYFLCIYRPKILLKLKT
jgi:hypothetical protein